MPGNDTINATTATSKNHSATSLTAGNTTFTHQERQTNHVAGMLLADLFSRLRSWFSSWFSRSAHDQLLHNLKTEVTQTRLNKLFQSLDAEIPKLKSDPSRIQNMQRGISEYFNNSLPYEQVIASEVMSEIHGFLQTHKLTNAQISQAITLIDLTKNLEEPKKNKIKRETPKQNLLTPKLETSDELLILMGKEFLQIFTGDSKALTTTTKDIAIEIGNLFHQFRSQDLSQGLDVELSLDASIFIGRTLANNRHRFGTHTRRLYQLEGDSYNENSYFQTSLKFLQVLLNTPSERKLKICAQTLVNILEPLHNQVMAARPNESIGGHEVVNDPNLSSDVEVLGQLLRHSGLGELGVPITTITLYEGATFTEDELTYLRAYDIDVPTQAPVSVSQLVISHQYRAALLASPLHDLPGLTEHLFQLLLNFNRRSEDVRRQAETRSGPSPAELINQQRQRERNVFSAGEAATVEAEAQSQQRTPRP